MSNVDYKGFLTLSTQQLLAFPIETRRLFAAEFKARIWQKGVDHG